MSVLFIFSQEGEDSGVGAQGPGLIETGALGRCCQPVFVSPVLRRLSRELEVVAGRGEALGRPVIYKDASETAQLCKPQNWPFLSSLTGFQGRLVKTLPLPSVPLTAPHHRPPQQWH